MVKFMTLTHNQSFPESSILLFQIRMVRTKQGKRVPGDEVAEDEAQVGSTTQEETKPAPTENGNNEFREHG